MAEQFMADDVVQHLPSRNYYQIITKGLMEDSLTPVYVYAGEFSTWVRPASEMEDGRFQVVYRPYKPKRA